MSDSPSHATNRREFGKVALGGAGTAAALLSVASRAGAAAEYPAAKISNGSIRAELYLPDAVNGYYRATRFDWSGVIASLECKGHNFLGVWFPKYDPNLHDSITGPVEEFRSGESALGYQEAKAGGTFIRIGVGVLRKPDEPNFQRFKTYEIVDPGKWTIRTAADSVEFVHVVGGAASMEYAYRYRKVVRLVKDQPRMTIEHSLKNTGTKLIETNVYNHNFFVIDGQPTSPDFVVRFPFELKADPDLGDLAETRGKELIYRQVLPAGKSVAALLSGFGADSTGFGIPGENRKTGAGVRVTGDGPLSKMYFWSIRTVLSPEPYIDMQIEPGAEFQWNLNYDFYTLSG